MPSITIDITVGVGADTKTGRITASNDAGIMVDVALTAAQANRRVSFPFKQTDIGAGALIFLADKSVTIKTNSSGSPADTFTVPAGGFYRVTALAADITDLYVTNNDASNSANLYCRGVMDVTPGS